MDKKTFDGLVNKMEVQTKLSWNRESCMIKSQVEDLNRPVRILEIGSGPGSITKRLLDLFPNSKITLLEIEEDFVKYSKEVLTKEYGDRVEFINGDITELEFNGEYDIVYARLVLQHVHGVEKAVENAYKALKKGGQIFITDIDEGLFGIIDPAIPELGYVLGQHIEEQVIEGGDRLIGRKLWRMLKGNNFQGINLELLPINSDEMGIKAFTPQVDYEEMETMVENDLITNDDINKIKPALDKFLNSEYPFVLLVMFFVTAKK